MKRSLGLLLTLALSSAISTGLVGCGGGDSGIDEGIDASEPVLIDDSIDEEAAIDEVDPAVEAPGAGDELP